MTGTALGARTAVRSGSGWSNRCSVGPLMSTAKLPPEAASPARLRAAHKSGDQGCERQSSMRRLEHSPWLHHQLQNWVECIATARGCHHICWLQQSFAAIHILERHNVTAAFQLIWTMPRWSLNSIGTVDRSIANPELCSLVSNAYSYNPAATASLLKASTYSKRASNSAMPPDSSFHC